MKRLLLIVAWALPLVAWADLPPIQEMAAHPSCLLYQSEQGPHALVQGAVVSERPETRGLVQELTDNNGHRYRAPVVDRRYELDVPATRVAWFEETGLTTQHGAGISTLGFRAQCHGAAVHVGTLTPVR